MKRNLILTLGMTFASASAFAAGQEASVEASALYDEWAGPDGTLTVAEWDSAVDEKFGEDAVNLAVARWDTDADGTITREEFAEAVANEDLFDVAAKAGGEDAFAAWDTNDDDMIDRAELEAGLGEADAFGQLDADDDNLLSEEEFAASGVEADFAAYDQDADASLDENEFFDTLQASWDETQDEFLNRDEFDDADELGLLDF